MFKTVLTVIFACLIASSAEARGRIPVACVETGTVMQPHCNGQNFLQGVDKIRVHLRRDRRANHIVGVTDKVRRHAASYGAPTTSWRDTTVYSQAVAHVGAIAKPIRYIAGRLICARNVNSWLEERGIRGTGSALAKSFLSWGRASQPVPGAVAVSSRRGGGHVAIVKEVRANGTIIVWNPSPRGRGWQEGVYRHRAISFRVAG